MISYKSIQKLIETCNRIYTRIVVKEMQEVGKSPQMEYPVYMRGAEYIKIGDDLKSYRNLRIEAYKVRTGKRKEPFIEIGDSVNLQPNCHIGCINHIKIGNRVVIASNVSILDHFHGNIDRESMDISVAKRPLVTKGEIVIGDNVWIGENVVILPNVKIGKNAIIGAGAVVSKDIPDYAVAAGIPARVIKQF